MTHIGVPEITVGDGEVTWSVPVSGFPESPDRLWFTLPAQYGDMVTPRADPALIGLLVPAMHAGGPLTIDGPVTDELAHFHRHEVQHIFHRVIGGLSRIPIETPHTVRAGLPAEGVATGFSGGVDCFAVLAEHHFADVAPDLKITHLTHFNLGSHGAGERGREMFRVRLARLAPVAAEMGLPLIPVDSNMDEFYGFWTHEQTHTPRTLAGASLLQGGIGRFYLGSGSTHARVGVFPSPHISFADAVLVPTVVTGQFRPILHGGEYLRVEKTVLITTLPITRTSLDVCVNPPATGGNCSRCFKCLRTELTLEIAGCLEDYAGVFDLDVYRQKRSVYLFETAVSDQPYATENRDFARRTGFRLPRVPRLLMGPGRWALKSIRAVRAALGIRR